MDKARILDEIRRTARESGGVALGARRFEQETGIATSAWRGKYWRQWSDAVAEAGFAPNRPNDAHEPDALVQHLVALTKKLGRFPTYADLRLAREADSAFPTHHAFNKLGSLSVRIALVRRVASDNPELRDVATYLPADAEEPDSTESAGVDGAVYMLKLGKHFKIGKSFSVPRRHREISIELPEKPDVVHVITTDDPSGIEAYWHKRFADRRTNGEWFALSRDDIKAFKRRKFM
jgi:hypothetical protein